MERRRVNVGKMARAADKSRQGRAETDWRGFLRRAQEVLSDLDELPERAEDFAESVREKIEDMRSWVEERERVTQRQEDALANMAEGVRRWQRGRR